MHTGDTLSTQPKFTFSYHELATILRCSEDKLRRISVEQLPRYRVGREIIFLRDDVIRFLRSHCRVSCHPGIDTLLSEVESDLLSSPPDGVRKRSPRRTP